MPVEDITESMHDKDDNATWLSIYDGQDFWRVRHVNGENLGFFDYENNPVKDEEVIQVIGERTAEWISQKNG
jgi:hypothetical protein